jgi:hypothetical protein
MPRWNNTRKVRGARAGPSIRAWSPFVLFRSNDVHSATGADAPAAPTSTSNVLHAQRSPGADVAGAGPVLVQMWQRGTL